METDPRASCSLVHNLEEGRLRTEGEPRGANGLPRSVKSVPIRGKDFVVREPCSRGSALLLQERNQVAKVRWCHSSLYPFRHQRKAARLQAFDLATWNHNLLSLGLQKRDSLGGFRAEDSSI